MTKKKLAEHEVYNQVLGENATRKVTIIMYLNKYKTAMGRGIYLLSAHFFFLT